MPPDQEIYGLETLEDAKPKPAPTGLSAEANLSLVIRDLILTYHALNSSTITTLESEPSPLEFMRHVAINRPFVIRGGANYWTACKKWNARYLTSVMAGQFVNVALTPHGNADSVMYLSPDAQVFVKPLERDEPFKDVVQAIQAQELDPAFTGPTRYAQTQNDNLRNEYADLFADVPNSIPFARIALQKEPDAINFWLGNSHSTTALHKDNYENVYVQILGKKHFVLLPPVEASCVNERSLLAATYTLRHGAQSSDGIAKGDLVVNVDEPTQYVPFATWDPDEPTSYATVFSELSQPLRVTLDEGDMLYLPALWYHKVSQSCSDEGLCCSVNYWYDLDFRGSFWSMAALARSAGILALQAEDCEARNCEAANVPKREH